MKKPQLIGLYSPVPGCGKDTMARHLARYNYANGKFAGPLKAMLAVFYRALGYSEEQLPEMLEGPNRHLIELFPAETQVLPSESMGTVTITIPAVTCRDAPQTLGTQWGRHCISRDAWITCARRSIERHLRAGTPVVMTDMRFPNEMKLIRELGGECWYVDRPQAPRPAKKHDSDGALDDAVFDLRLRNASTIVQLEAAIDAHMNRA